MWGMLEGFGDMFGKLLSLCRFVVLNVVKISLDGRRPIGSVCVDVMKHVSIVHGSLIGVEGDKGEQRNSLLNSCMDS